jgi:Transcriptional regulator, AbiEi antitoxin
MARIAAGQGGVLTAEQCRAVGADPSALRRLISAGAWAAARRGVYRELTWSPCLPLASERPGDLVSAEAAARAAAHHVRCAALLAALRPARAVVSHHSALILLGLPLPPGVRDSVVITRPPPAPANRLGRDTEIHVTRYDVRDVLDVAGVPVLGGARLLLDCCAAMAPDSALAVADAALFRGYCTHDALDRELERRAGRLGAPVAAKIVERVDPLAESWFESISRWWLLEAGLPRPRLQTPFYDDAGRCRAKADLWFPDFNTVGEADGAGKYDEPGALFAEKRREDWLRDVHRVEVVRWVPSEMRNSEGRKEVVNRFLRAFARGSPSALQQQNGLWRAG